MDSTKSSPFELGAGADACLLIHGFTGSPWELRPLGEALALRGFRVKAPLLPGHGGRPEDMEQADRHDWLRAAEGALAGLSGHRRVYVCGLSMGALLALLLADRRPERVAALALLAPALELQGKRAAILRAVRRLPLFELARPYISKGPPDLEDEAERAEAPQLGSFPLVRLNDLWELQDEARAALPRVVAPTLVVVAARDTVVSAKGARALVRGLRNAKPVRFIRVEQGAHQLVRDFGRATVISEVIDFFTR